MGKKLIDLVGKTFGFLTVLKREGLVGNQPTWLCSCKCGKTFVALGYKLRGGIAVSCGCRVGGPTHGHTRGSGVSPTYRSWHAMISRCTQPSNAGYEYYKRRGIEICERWLKFENFLSDMGERPSMDHSLDRYPNNDGNYEPGNCRWATKREQANNRITNRLFFYNSRNISLTELSRETGMSHELLRHRLLRANWTLEEALSSPKVPGSRRDLGKR